MKQNRTGKNLFLVYTASTNNHCTFAFWTLLPVPNRLDEGVINIKYNYACFYYITLVAMSTTGVEQSV